MFIKKRSGKTSTTTISDVVELFNVQAIGLTTIELDFKLSKKADEHGTEFRYRANVKDSKGNQLAVG